MILFDKIIFGPVKSRRLGVSLGVNLLPVDAKICSFDCVYCGMRIQYEDKRGFYSGQGAGFFRPWKPKLKEMVKGLVSCPTVSLLQETRWTLLCTQDFEGCYRRYSCIARPKYCPKAQVSVLSNSTHMHKPGVFKALNKVDQNILKFDSALDETVHRA